MEKLNFNPVSNKEMEKSTEELVHALEQEAIVRKVFQKNGIPAECLERYPWKINSVYRGYPQLMHKNVDKVVNIKS